MSGINEIKKKTKLSIDEMYDNQEVGNMVIQQNGSPEIKQTNHPVIQKVSNPLTHPDSQPNILPDGKINEHKNSHTPNNTSIHKAGNTETHLIKEHHLSPATKPPMQKVQTYKMTFNLTEDTYKAFNDLYATRMLQGRKTEKSEMICEAIEWLIKMEA